MTATNTITRIICICTAPLFISGPVSRGFATYTYTYIRYTYYMYSSTDFDTPRNYPFLVQISCRNSTNEQTQNLTRVDEGSKCLSRGTGRHRETWTSRPTGRRYTLQNHPHLYNFGNCCHVNCCHVIHLTSTNATEPGESSTKALK